MTKAKAKRIHADEALPVWVLDAQFTGLFEVYAINNRLELRRDGWLLDDDEDNENGLERLKRSAAERAEERQE